MHMIPKKVCDIAIIGGGIAGAAIARDASLRGLSVILFEKNTVGSGTSSKTSRLIHGGIRYLEVAWKSLIRFDVMGAARNFLFVLHSLREARLLEKMAPDLIQRHAILIPVYKSDPHHRMEVYLGAFLYGLLGILTGSKSFPRVLSSASAVLHYLPQLNKEGLQGGVLIFDRLTDDLRLVQKIIASAKKEGANVLEHTEVIGYHNDKKEEIFLIQAKIKGQDTLFGAKKLINASGPWVDQVRECGKERKDNFIQPVAGSHIIVKRLTQTSVLLQAQDSRLLFIISDGEESRIGTTERFNSNPDQVKTTPDEIQYLTQSLLKYFPHMPLGHQDILSTQAGVRPLAFRGHNQNASAISREHEIRVSPSGMINVIGVKLTDHRRAAKEVVDGLTRRKCRTHKVPLS
jgi:glycerol-3-phosphate dehydrogenase